MPPRAFQNPAPKTESARNAAAAFHCTLCAKSYSRQPEFEAHISSYDHQHRKRLRDLKQLSRHPQAAERARRAERRADEEAGLVAVSLEGDTAGKGKGGGGGGGGSAAASSTGGGGGFKKGGFKSSFTKIGGGGANVGNTGKNVLADDDEKDEKKIKQEDNENVPALDETDTEDEFGPNYYDPARPTDCSSTCAGVQV